MSESGWTVQGHLERLNERIIKLLAERDALQERITELEGDLDEMRASRDEWARIAGLKTDEKLALRERGDRLAVAAEAFIIDVPANRRTVSQQALHEALTTWRTPIREAAALDHSITTEQGAE